MKIKNAEIGMLDEIYDVEKSVWRHVAASKSSLKRRIRLFPEGFFVAILNNKINSFKDLYPFERIHRKNGEIFYIYSLCVLPRYRRKDITRCLLQLLLYTSIVGSM